MTSSKISKITAKTLDQGGGYKKWRGGVEKSFTQTQLNVFQLNKGQFCL